jgi:hypothetical protein
MPNTPRRPRRAAARTAARAVVLVPALVSACGRARDQLLEPQNPGVIGPGALASPDAANALRVGALGRYRQVATASGSESLWQMGGVLADEFKNSASLSARVDVDRRAVDPSSNWGYAAVTLSRGQVRGAIAAMKEYLPARVADIGELYLELGFFEMSLADTFCNGVPLGHTVAGVQTFGAPLTTAQVYDSALAHVDSALITNTATDAAGVFVRRAALVMKARVLVAKGQYAAAAALVTPAAVPTTYQYLMTFSPATSANGFWSINHSVARISVGDSVDTIDGARTVIRNALPFASANDPRVPVVSGATATPRVQAEDGVTPLFLGQLHRGQYDPLVIFSGVDARLVEAEARLNAGDFSGMIAILNALRATGPAIGTYRVPVMPALAAVPATKDAAVDLFFREKAFWTFARGQRLPDLRRLIRQYGRTQEQVFPSGAFFKGGVYGRDVNLPIPTLEQANPLFSGCLDRDA